MFSANFQNALYFGIWFWPVTNEFKGVDKSFAIQAGREIRVMVVPEQVTDADMVLLARDISKQIEAELEYPGQIKVNVIRESRAVDYAK